MDHPERKRIRLKDYDYSQNGAYFITICTKNKKQLLWRVGETFGRPSEIIPLSDIGGIVRNEIELLANIYENVSVDKSVIMANHIHLIICISRNICGRSETAPTVSQIVQQFKASISRKAGFRFGRNLSMTISSAASRNTSTFGNTSIQIRISGRKTNITKAILTLNSK